MLATALTGDPSEGDPAFPLRGTIHNDDSQIKLLDLMKIRMRDNDEEWVAVRARLTAIDLHAGVYDPSVNHTLLVDLI